MGILERTLGAISPGWAAARARDRLRLNAYEAANPSRLHKAKKQSQSADTSVFAAGQSLREQARWLDENHDLVIGLFDKMEDRVIGAHGIHVEPQPLDLEGNLHSDFAGQLSALWAEWSVRPEVTGMFTRPEAERLLLRSALRDGEVFTQMVRGNVAGLQHSTQVPFSLELLEADFVPFNLNSTSGQQIRQGIIVNAWGRPTGYRVYKNHPASFAGLNADLKTVSADSMLHLATPILDNVIDFTATIKGREGNVINVAALAGQPAAENPAAVVTSASWDPESLTLKITLGCDEHGVITAKPGDVAEAVGGVDGAKVSASGRGDGIVQPFSLQLAGGEDEPFPLNTPVAVVGTTLLSRLGEKGTLKQALTDINDQRNALTVVVRVADENDVAKRRAAVLKGIGTLSSAKSVTTYQPRIVIAPGFSEDDAVGKGLETVAGKLRAVAYVDCASGATLQEVVQRRQSYGARTELLRPRVQASDADGQLVYRPYSAFAAGLRARIDFEKGWWWSKSNQDINNILGVEQIDEFILGDENCDANLLNMQNVSTIIRRAGFKHWGNRLCATNPQWRFESVRRTADVIEDSIQETMLEYVDRPLDRENADDIIGTINAYMRQLVGLGAIFGGRAWLDEELNTAETMASGGGIRCQPARKACT